jgi:hypothetical protein
MDSLNCDTCGTHAGPQRPCAVGEYEGELDATLTLPLYFGDDSIITSVSVVRDVTLLTDRFPAPEDWQKYDWQK